MLVGYGAIIARLDLAVPTPERVSSRNRKYQNKQWQVFPFRYLPEDTLYHHLVFAIKYEGIQLLFFKKLFLKLPEKEIQIIEDYYNDIFF